MKMGRDDLRRLVLTATLERNLQQRALQKAALKRNHEQSAAIRAYQGQRADQVSQGAGANTDGETSSIHHGVESIPANRIAVTGRGLKRAAPDDCDIDLFEQVLSQAGGRVVTDEWAESETDDSSAESERNASASSTAGFPGFILPTQSQAFPPSSSEHDRSRKRFTPLSEALGSRPAPLVGLPTVAATALRRHSTEYETELSGPLAAATPKTESSANAALSAAVRSDATAGKDPFELQIQSRDFGLLQLHAEPQPHGWHVRIKATSLEHLAWLQQRKDAIARGLSRDLRADISVEIVG